jgi:hypothetical protein
MTHVGLHSVGTYHKKFGRQNKKIKIYLAECLMKTLGKDSFAECQLGGTRPRIGKEYFKIKKKLCRVPDHGHSAKHAYIPTTALSSSLSLSHSLSTAAVAPSPSPRPRRRRRALPRARAAVPSRSRCAASAAPAVATVPAAAPAPAVPRARRASRPPLCPCPPCPSPTAPAPPCRRSLCPWP